jgi:tRNA(Leu) C34 or U34 (ribose-2'-O)-methylase TrmL
MNSPQIGKNAPKLGRTPAVALCNPRFPHNVGAAVRAASCCGVSQVWYSGDRVQMAMDQKKRLPREERMKGFQDVELRQFDNFFDQFGPETVPVAVELRPNAESLPSFVHPENALYVFGPEDGSIPQVMLRHCHRFLVIPTRHCVNLAAAAYLVLFDRMVKMASEPLTIRDTLAETRFDFANDDFAEKLGLRSAER